MCRSSDGQDKGTTVHTLKPGTTRLYTWDYPLHAQELFWQVIGDTVKKHSLKLKVRKNFCNEVK